MNFFHLLSRRPRVNPLGHDLKFNAAARAAFVRSFSMSSVPFAYIGGYRALLERSERHYGAHGVNNLDCLHWCSETPAPLNVFLDLIDNALRVIGATLKERRNGSS